MLDHHVDRRLRRVVSARLAEEPVIALQGMRSVGKSTLLRDIAARHQREIIDLDDLATREVVATDPALFVAEPGPVLIDEFQHVPMLLDAIKAELNKALRPGRFVITGSTSYESLPRAAQSLTGRLHVLPVWPLSQGELGGVEETFVETLLHDPVALVSPARSSTTREEYIARIVGGGLPLVLARQPGAARARWFEDFLARVLERDVVDVSRIRQRSRLPGFLARVAAQSGQVLNTARAARDADLERGTADAYLRLLEAVFLVYRLPAWGRTLRSRAAASPKVHVTDSGLAAHLLRLSAPALERRTPAAVSELGHLAESFAVGEVHKQLTFIDEIIHPGHWRTHDGVEVDLVLERHDRTVAAIEVKMSSRVRTQDISGLRKLRDAIGDAFTAGVVLYAGEHAYRLDDRLYAVPMDRLWLA